MIQKKKNLLIYLIVSLSFTVFYGCKDKTPVAENNKEEITNVADTASGISGLYEAILPCADCKGIETKIYLKNNYTYIKEENYKGVSDTMTHIFYDLGRWSVQDSVITLTGLTADTLRFRYDSMHTIQMLAHDGTVLPDSASSQYHFTYKKSTFSTSKPFIVTGVLDRSQNINSLYVCVWKASCEVSFSEKAKTQLDSLWHASKIDEHSKAIVQGEAILNPRDPEKFVIQKVNSVLAGDNCN